MNDSIHPDTSLGSVALTVSNLDRSIAFYEQAIGFRVRARDEKTARLGAGGGDLIALTEHPDASPLNPRHTGLYHFAILVPSRLDLARSLKHLVEMEIQFQGFADHLVSEAMYLADPDGNGIEIYRDRPREEWRSVNGQLQIGTDPLDLRGVLSELERDGTQFNGMHSTTKIGHMHLQVANIPAAQAFYCGVLGFDLVMRYGPSAFFVSAGGYHHHIGLNTWNSSGAPPPPKNSIGLRHFVIRLPNAAELDKVAERVGRAEIAAEKRNDGLFVRDPSHNGILLTAS